PNLLVDGTITCLLKSGKHYTYKIESVKKGPLEGKQIVSLLNGPDNYSNYKGFGFTWLDNAWGSPTQGNAFIRIWKKCRTIAFIKHVQLLTGQADEHVQEWMQEGCCMICGRKLINPVSLRAGMGPVCAGRS
ncbi:unnamed protein product, partial [marine sediment metagenome]